MPRPITTTMARSNRCGTRLARLAELYDQGLADGVRIQYGGSVKSGNVAAIMAQPDVDGALVGGAATIAEEFVKIVRFGDQRTLRDGEVP